MNTIKMKNLKSDFELTWEVINKHGVKYVAPKNEIYIRKFLESNGYSICVDSSVIHDKYKPRFVFHGREVGVDRKFISDDYEWCTLKKAEEIALKSALKDFEEQLYLSLFK